MQLQRHALALGLAGFVLASAAAVSVGGLHAYAPLLSIATGIAALWIMAALVLLVRQTGRPERLSRLMIWIPTVALSAVALNHVNEPARRLAESVVSAVEAHKAATGTYPKTLNEVGQDPQQLKSGIGLVYSLLADGKPDLYYSEPSGYLVAYRFNFTTKQWLRED